MEIKRKTICEHTDCRSDHFGIDMEKFKVTLKEEHGSLTQSWCSQCVDVFYENILVIESKTEKKSEKKIR